MDEKVLAKYLRELVHQGRFTVVAVEDLNRALKQPSGTTRAFAAVQSLLAAAAMVSKLLWPAERSGRVARSRGIALRRVLRVDEMPNIQALSSRAVRNGYEHFDERLDSFLASGEQVMTDLNIGAPEAFDVGGKKAKHLRLIDPDGVVIWILEEKTSGQELYNAISAIADAARRELDRIEASSVGLQ